MKILIYSPFFYPRVGGTETMMGILAEEFCSIGHAVKVVTYTEASSDNKYFPYEIIRYPRAYQILQFCQWCDVFLQASVSLKGIWATILTRKPIVFSHHTWYHRRDGRQNWKDLLKKFVTSLGKNIAVSKAIAASLPAQCEIIPNTYQDKLFQIIPVVDRDKELVFLGRLVSDKGVHLLLDAVARLKQSGLYPRLTIIGNGPDRFSLEEQARNLDLVSQIEFLGEKTGGELVEVLNQHKIMVVPSLWDEPFGIVALEGIACGCVIVGSSSGGLFDAIGKCGITFPNGDEVSLANALYELLTRPDLLLSYQKYRDPHLSSHHSTVIAKSYLAVFEDAIKG